MKFQAGNDRGKIGNHELKAKSPISVGRRLLSGRVKMTTAAGRRYRDLIKLYSEGITSIGAYEMTLIKQAAGMTVASERVQEQILAGEPIDERKSVRIMNTVIRTLGQLKRISMAQKRERAESSSFSEFVASLNAREEAK
jgi:hypothetical protein